MRAHWLIGCVIVGCGGEAAVPPPGLEVVHTPPPNADSLHRVSVQLYYGDYGPAFDTSQPLGGWKVEAQLVKCHSDDCISFEVIRSEAVARTDTHGVAVFWLEQAGPYNFDSELRASDPGCWREGSIRWREGDSPDRRLELSVVCT